MHPVMAAVSLLPGLEREIRLLPHLIRAGQTCVDVGASWGVYTVPLALLVGVGGRVIAFEPRRAAARRLARLTAMLRLEQVTVQACALGRDVDEARLVIPRLDGRIVPGRAFVAPGTDGTPCGEELTPARVVRVPRTTLGEVGRSLDGPIDFVKCDVEGAELEVFSGGSSVLERDRPFVLCEVEDRHVERYDRTASEVFALFEDLRYVDLSRGIAARRTEARNHLFVPGERLGEIRAKLDGRV